MLVVILLGLLKASLAINITNLPALELAEDDDVTARPPLLASTQNGIIQGITLEATNNKTVSSFLGIPFAMPPIGDLRFKPPSDPPNWSGIRPTDTQPPSCMQRPDLFFEDFEGAKESQPTMPPSEDCLYLNIFVPDIHVRVHQGRNEEARSVLQSGLPVVVWLHGGGFSSGSSLNRGPILDTWTPDPRELASTGQVWKKNSQLNYGGQLLLANN